MIQISDAVIIAAIAGVPAILGQISNLIMTINNHKENSKKLDAINAKTEVIQTQTNGVVERLVSTSEAKGKAEGKVEVLDRRVPDQ